MHILVELDDATLDRLEKVAPARSRKRLAFIRAAIQSALWALDEQRTRRAYLEAPADEPAPFDAASWEPLAYGGFDPPVTAPGTRSRRRRAKGAGR